MNGNEKLFEAGEAGTDWLKGKRKGGNAHNDLKRGGRSPRDSLRALRSRMAWIRSDRIGSGATKTKVVVPGAMAERKKGVQTFATFNLETFC